MSPFLVSIIDVVGIGFIISSKYSQTASLICVLGGWGGGGVGEGSQFSHWYPLPTSNAQIG